METIDKEILMLVQNGIPFTREPFREIAEKNGFTEEELLSRLNVMKRKGVIRRFSANIDQRKLGITANAVVVWKIVGEALEKALPVFMSQPDVTHLYERVVYPGKWEYNLYSVVHGYSDEDVRELIQELSSKVGERDYQIFFSKRRFKGTSSKLGSEEDKE
jgi:DNA-binding Lrp family transcriptional regulator